VSINNSRYSEIKTRPPVIRNIT